jgi:hypothetical protein
MLATCENGHTPFPDSCGRGIGFLCYVTCSLSIQRTVLDWKINKTKLERRERDDYLVDNPVIQICGEMARYIQKDDPYDKAVDEFLLNTYTNIDERELQVCKTVIWAIWDNQYTLLFRNCCLHPKF